MGRAAGAALTVVAPEAKLASKAAGAAGHRRPPPAPDPRVTRPGSEAARTRQLSEDLRAKRADAEPEPAPESPPPASPGGGLSLPGTPAAASTGSGFLLGVFAWAVGLAYLQGGSAGVKKFLAAKFLNKT